MWLCSDIFKQLVSYWSGGWHLGKGHCLRRSEALSVGVGAHSGPQDLRSEGPKGGCLLSLLSAGQRKSEL